MRKATEKEIKDFLVYRANHVALVQRIGKVIFNTDLSDHDHDKIEADGDQLELFALRNSMLNGNYNPSTEDKKKLNALAKQHILSQPHHPEKWSKEFNVIKHTTWDDENPIQVHCSKMPKKYLLEMVADWCSVAFKKNQPLAKWPNKTVFSENPRFIFTDNQKKYIVSCINKVIKGIEKEHLEYPGVSYTAKQIDFNYSLKESKTPVLKKTGKLVTWGDVFETMEKENIGPESNPTFDDIYDIMRKKGMLEENTTYNKLLDIKLPQEAADILGQPISMGSEVFYPKIKSKIVEYSKKNLIKDIENFEAEALDFYKKDSNPIRKGISQGKVIACEEIKDKAKNLPDEYINPEELNNIFEKIVKDGNKWKVTSHDGSKNLGTYDTKAEAEKRLKQVEYFKSLNESFAVVDIYGNTIPGTINQDILQVKKLRDLLVKKYNSIFKIQKVAESLGIKSVFSLKEAVNKKVPDVLYRNDLYYGSGELDIFNVLKYEINELGNSDILYYCRENYNLSKDVLMLINTHLNDEDFSYIYPDNFFEHLIADISKETGKDIKYALWLANKDAIVELYDGNEENISAYETSNVILSDLGYDGLLFAYEEIPQGKYEKLTEDGEGISGSASNTSASFSAMAPENLRRITSLSSELSDFDKAAKAVLQESILDIPHKEYCEDILIDDKLKPEVRNQILSIIEKWKDQIDFDFKIKKVYAKGSLFTKKYVETSDLDVSLYTDMTQEQLNDIFDIIPKGQNIEGTEHPLDFFVLIDGEETNEENLDNIYDVLNDTWIKRSEEYNNEIPIDYLIQTSNFFINGCTIALSNYENDKAMYDYYMSLDPETHDISKDELTEIIEDKKRDLKSDLDGLKLALHMVKSFRQEVYDDEPNPFTLSIEIPGDNKHNTWNEQLDKILSKFKIKEKLVNAVKECQKILDI